MITAAMKKNIVPKSKIPCRLPLIEGTGVAPFLSLSVFHTYRSAYVIIQIPITRTYLILHDRQFQFRSEPQKLQFRLD